MKAKIRLMVVDHNAGSRPAQKVYRLLVKMGFEILPIVPKLWKEAHGLVAADTQGAKGLVIVGSDVLASGSYHRSWFVGLADLAAAFKPNLLWAHAEPENLLAWQAQGIARKQNCALALVSWRNIVYPQGRIPYKFSWLYGMFEKISLKAKAKVFCYNDQAMDIIGGMGFQVSRIDLGVDTDIFKKASSINARKKLKLPVKSFVVGFAGRCQPEKGVSDLIQAMAGIKNSLLLIVGGGAALDDWRKMAHSSGVELVQMSMPQKDMPLAINAMDVLALPSRTTSWWKEQYGRILVEAMACAKALVGSDSGAIPRVIGSGKNAAGLVFPEGNVKILKKVLTKMQDIKTRNQYAKNGQKMIKERYGWPAAVSTLAVALEATVKDFR